MLRLCWLRQQRPTQSFNAARAMQYTREIVAFGPRPIGSANHKKLENYILAHLKNDQVEEDAFTADTPEGKFPVRNIIAKFPGTRDGIIVIAGHYDTNYPLRNTGYVGANDGGSSTAILLELANQLRGKKREGYSVWLFWTDGEEAVKDWTDTDSLYGARHLADKWQKDGTLKNIKAFLLADMIGDADLNVDRDSNSTPWLEDHGPTRPPHNWATSPTSSPAPSPSKTTTCRSCNAACPAPISSISTTATATSSTTPRKTPSTNSAPKASRSSAT